MNLLGDKIVVTHRPSGVQATCLLTSYRSMHLCKEAALKLLRSRLWAADQMLLSSQDLTWDYDTTCSKNSPTKN